MPFGGTARFCLVLWRPLRVAHGADIAALAQGDPGREDAAKVKGHEPGLYGNQASTESGAKWVDDQ